ncbi:MAG: sulfotransferase domain-containing protein [Nitrospira sp.]|nr:sulfotransferase domain-containing protein [Nitrospira sp.]
MMHAVGVRGEGPCFSLDEYIGRITADLSMVASGDLPDFFILSPPRTGTTWLANALKKHRDVYIPPEKELRYFDVGWRFGSIHYYTGRYARSNGRLKGDASPTYVLLPQGIIRLLRQTKPDLKCIVILRDLDDRAWSNFRHSCEIGEFGFRLSESHPQQSLDEAACRYLMSDYCTSVGDYKEYLTRWTRHYPLNQFLILRLQDIASDPKGVIARACAFLGVSTYGCVTDGLSEKINMGVRIPASKLVNGLLRVLYQARHAEQRSFFHETFGMEVPDHFPVPDPVETPFELVNRADGYKTIIWNGCFVSCWQEEFPELLRMVREQKDVRATCLTSRHLSELERQIEDQKWGRSDPRADQQLEDERLTRVLNLLAQDYPRSCEIKVHGSKPTIVREHKGFNLVLVENLVVGLRQSRGSVDLRDGPEHLLAKYGARDVIVAGSVAEAIYAIDVIEDRETCIEECREAQLRLGAALQSVQEQVERLTVRHESVVVHGAELDRRMAELRAQSDEAQLRLGAALQSVQEQVEQIVNNPFARIGRLVYRSLRSIYRFVFGIKRS